MSNAPRIISTAADPRWHGADWVVLAEWHGAERQIFRGDIFGCLRFVADADARKTARRDIARIAAYSSLRARWTGGTA